MALRKITGQVIPPQPPPKTMSPDETFAYLWRHGGPMRPMDYEDAKDPILPPQWLMQEKLRGIRGILYKGLVYSRDGNRLYALDYIFPTSEELIFDGELYIEGLSQEEMISVIRGNALTKDLYFRVFDMVDFGMVQCTRLDTLRRFCNKHSRIWPISQIQDFDEADYEYHIKLGHEGVVYRNLYAKYGCGYQPCVRKRKPSKDAEAKVIGVLEEVSKDGTPQGRAGSLQCVLDNGITFKCAGLNDTLKSRYWLQPPKRITFKYDHLSDAGVPVHANFLCEREENI